MKQKVKKVKGYTISEREPKAGDIMICINKKSVNFGCLEEVNAITVKAGAIDTVNWKVVMDKEEAKEKIVDAVIESLKEDFAAGDYTVLDELLKMIPNKNLVQSLDEDEWKKFSYINLK